MSIVGPNGSDVDEAFRKAFNEMGALLLPELAQPKLLRRGPSLHVSVLGTDLSSGLAGGHEGRTEPGDEETEGPHLYQLFFGTNRKPSKNVEPATHFSAERDRRLHYGKCTVAIPKAHKIGSIGSSWVSRIRHLIDDRLRITTLERRSSSDIFGDIHSSLKEGTGPQKDLLLVIHGYNVTFKDAALRAAQIAWDIKAPGPTAFFSWPSKGKSSRYFADESTIAASAPYIAEFIQTLVNETRPRRLNVLAHSMGNRGFLYSLRHFIDHATRSLRIPFGHLLLTAPDVDQEEFQALVTPLPQRSYRTTIYVSSRDKALRSSGLIHNYPRAGYTPPVACVTGADTIEVTNVDLTFLGHGYYGSARPVLSDLHALLYHDARPEIRLGLGRRVTSSGDVYWQIGR